MGMAKAFLHRTKVASKLLLFMTATYMTITQILRYLENSDASSVAFKTFNEHPNDKYPTFTFCFFGENGEIYSDHITELTITKQQYSDILKKGVLSGNYSSDMPKMILRLDHETLTIQLNRFLDGFEFKRKHAKNTIAYDRNLLNPYIDPLTEKARVKEKEKIKSAFFISYQDPVQICFTRSDHSEPRKHHFRQKDTIDFALRDVFPDFNKAFMCGYNCQVGGYFRFYIHYPGQFTRYKDKPLVEIPRELLRYKTTHISLNIAYVTILRKRPDATTPCDPELTNDDDIFKIRVTKEVGCIPSYWIALLESNMDLPLCETPNQLQKVYRHIQNFTGFMTAYKPPCDEMQAPVNVQRTKEQTNSINGIIKSNLHIIITYTTDRYQEINNNRDFDFETFFSCVGGFIGIFLGYSLLQLTDLLDEEWRDYWTAAISVCQSTWYLCTTAMALFFGKRRFILSY